jgi:hypothetical protein
MLTGLVAGQENRTMTGRGYVAFAKQPTKVHLLFTSEEILKIEADIDPGHFFKVLKSPRRLANITSLNALLLPVMRRRCDDPFARFGELDPTDRT